MPAFPRLGRKQPDPPPLDKPGRALAIRAAATRNSLTAAVTRFDMSGVGWRDYRFGDRAWQTDAWRLYDVTGQLRFVANWIGASLSRCILRVHEIDDQGNFGAPVDDPDIARLGTGPLGVGDARAEALRLAGIDLFVPGECFMIAEAEGGVDGSDIWWVVTARQIKKQGDLITIPRSPIHGGGTFVYRDGVDLILRVWTPHPADTNEPDSSTRSAIPDLRKMEAIRKREFAELDSRLTGAGMLLMPDSMDLPRGEDDPEGPDGFAALMSRVMGMSLRDRSSAAAMVPMILQGNREDIEAVKHLTFWSPMSAELGPMWETTLRSLAEDLDVPPEVMTGLGGSNHWSAWAISDAAITQHIAPVASRVAAALTMGYLWPALEALGIDDPTQFGYRFDTSMLAARPNRSADAMVFHQAGLISDDAARAAGAWIEDDAPDDTERARRLVSQIVAASPQMITTDPGVREAVTQLLGITLGSAPQTTADAGTVAPQTTPEVESGNGPPDTLPAETDQRPDSAPSGTPSVASLRRPVDRRGLETALALVLRRAMTLAGQRLVPHSKRAEYGCPGFQLSHRYGPVSGDRVPVLLAKAWDDLDVVGTHFDLDTHTLETMLTELCHGLLTRGIAYTDDMVHQIVSAPGIVERLRAHG